VLRALKLAGLSLNLQHAVHIVTHIRGQHAVICCAVLTCGQGGAIFAGDQAEVLVTNFGFLSNWRALVALSGSQMHR
jgi:hypothetical protein